MALTRLVKKAVDALTQFALSGPFTANGATGTAGQILRTGGSGNTHWSSRMTHILPTTTGAVDNWAPTGLLGDTFIEWAGTANAAFTGLAGGVNGQTVTIANYGTAGTVLTFAYASGSSSAGNKFYNAATSAPTPVAVGGWVTYIYGTISGVGAWIMVDHEQGAWITPTFAAGDYTAATGTWTVDSGDVVTAKYRLSGRTLHFNLHVQLCDISNTAAPIKRAVPGGFTITHTVTNLIRAIQGSTHSVGLSVMGAGATVIDFYPAIDAANWTATSSDNAYVIGGMTFEVT